LEARSHAAAAVDPGNALVAAHPCVGHQTPAFRHGERRCLAEDGNFVARRSGSCRGHGYVERADTSFQMVVAAADRTVGHDLWWRENSPTMTHYYNAMQ